MEVIDKYLDYRKHKPEYKPWKEEKDSQDSKRLSYISKNAVSDDQKNNDFKRAQAVLNAVDIMDEFSQTRAEDMEAVVMPVQNAATSLITYFSMGVGGLLYLLSKHILKNKKAAGVIAVAVGGIFSLLAIGGVSQWGAKQEVKASKNGRFEAMKNELSDIRHFAVLDENQEKQVENLAKNMEIEKKEAKKMGSAKAGLGIIKSFKTITNSNKELEEEKKAFKEKLNSDFEKIKTAQLTNEQIGEAKKDKQLISNIVEKIDIASQDYAENTELATGIISTSLFGAGGILALITNKILKALKVSQKISTIATLFSIFALPLAFGFLSAKVQKQASKVARFKVKQEFKNNINNAIYVDDEKVKNEDGEKFKNESKKPNFAKFCVQMFKDNKEYNDYLKTQDIENKKRQKALSQIKLTPEQEKRAKQLQQNVFKMFNKVDEKSQSYSESTESLGEIVQNGGGLLAGLFSVTGMFKMDDYFSKVGDNDNMVFAVIKSPVVRRLLISIIPLVIMNILITKEQKQASRVADMLAIKEMDDYKNFADYTDNKTSTHKAETFTSVSDLTPPWKK